MVLAPVTAPRKSDAPAYVSVWNKGASKRFAVGEADTIGKRPTMEDATLIHGCLGGDEELDLFAIFDGHGSEKVAAYCAENFARVYLANRQVTTSSAALGMNAESVATWSLSVPGSVTRP